MPKRQRGLSLLSYAPQPSNKVLTAGEVLSGGTFLDIVRGDGLTALLVWNGKEIQFARQFDCKEASYFAIHIDRATAEAVRFPKGVRPYKSTRELFDSVTSLVSAIPGLLKRDVALLAYFVLTTWTCDRLDSLPLVWVTAPAPIQTGVLFQVLRFACRRVILAADPTLSGLRSLPMELRPTLLIEVPRLTHAIAKLLRATSRRGALANGRHVDLSCPRVVVARHAPPDPAEIGHPVEIALMPDDSRRPWIDLTEAERIAGEDLQERLEAYRLACLMSASPEDLDFDGLTGPMREIAHTLARCILDDDELRAAIVPLLKPLDREIHVDLTTRLEAILLEALLTLIHEGLTTASMAELTSRTNTILVGRGMAEQVSPETVGWRIRALGLHSEFIPGGRKGVALTDEMAAMIHRLAWSYGVRTFQAGNFDRNCRRCAVFFPSTGADGESVPVSS